MYGLVSFLGLLGYLLYRPKYQYGEKAKNVEFVIPSTADNKTLNSLRETVQQLHRKFSEYTIWVVVDEGNHVSLDGATLVTVPENFPGKRCKGRALEYFRQNYVTTDKWYVFLDDDSIPADDIFLFEIPYYEQRGYVAANGILIPRKGRSALSFILDHLRYWDDIFLFRLTTGALKSPIIGLHGELLIVQGSVLRQVPFSTSSLVEDFVFAQVLIKHGYKTWQSKTLVSIKSPNNLKDFFKQRARWIKGIITELHRCRPISWFLITFRVVGGIGSSIVFIPLWFIFPMVTPLATFGWFGTVYYLSSYIYGIIKEGDFKYFLLLPIMGIFEPISVLYTWRTAGFTMIDKNP